MVSILATALLTCDDMALASRGRPIALRTIGPPKAERTLSRCALSFGWQGIIKPARPAQIVDREATIIVKQTSPYPMTVTGLYYGVEAKGAG